MDLQRIRDHLSPQRPSSLDLDAAWSRYRREGGLDEDDAFESWLAAQYPHLADTQCPRSDAPVEVSRVLPARFATPADRVASAVEAPTVVTAQRDLSLPTVDTHAAAQVGDAPFHYELLGTAGKGGMGTVLIARDTELLRRVALKQLNADADAIPNARTRFLREVQITAQLDHPNIVPVYALELAPGGAPAYTMKLVEGKTFHVLLNEARDFFEGKHLPDESRTLAARLEHFLKVCDAMAYAHDKGVIHRDLKPANLMLGRHNEVYVMDWGLCRVLRQPDETPPDKSVVMSSPDSSGSASETQIGDVVGTPKYMSPEQARGRNAELDACSDQCALGLILYELATLNPPYPGRTAYEVLANASIGKRRPVLHAYLGKRIPRELVAIIERATAFAPSDRYARVADLATDLRRYLRGEAVHAQPDAPWQRAQRWIVRHKQAALTTVLATIALAAIAIGGLLWQNQRLFKSERLREQRLLALTHAVANVKDRVQMRFIQIEGAIVNLADSVAQSLASPGPAIYRYYLSRDFRTPANAPADLQPSSIVGGKVSLDYPVWSIPPGMRLADAEPMIASLSRLQHFRREIYQRVATMIKSGNRDLYTEDPGIAHDDNNPVKAMLIGLDNGINSRYPGWDGVPDDYDPRQHPWYRLAVGKHGPQWGIPYRSGITNTLELPLSVPVYNARAHQIGVVGALLMPDLMVKSLLGIKHIPGVRGVYLLDRDGHVLAALGNLALPAAANVAPDQFEVRLFPSPILVAQVKADRSGIIETRLDGKPVVIVSAAAEVLQLHIVAVADPKLLFAAATQLAH